MTPAPLHVVGLAAAPAALLPSVRLPQVPVVVDQVEGTWVTAELPDGRLVELPLGWHPLAVEGAGLLLGPAGPCPAPPPSPPRRPLIADLPDHIDLVDTTTVFLLPPPRVRRGTPPNPPAPAGASTQVTP